MSVEAVNAFLESVFDGIKKDAQDKNQRIPVSSFRIEANEEGGSLYGADYFKYLVYGRGPGKQPPPDAMLKFVESSPETQAWTDSEKRSLAYVIGRKIAMEGTEIYAGRRAGIDLLGIIEKSTDELLQTLAKNQVFNIKTALQSAIKK